MSGSSTRHSRRLDGAPPSPPPPLPAARRRRAPVAVSNEPPLDGFPINAGFDQLIQAMSAPFDPASENPANGPTFPPLAEGNSFNYNFFDHNRVLPLNEEDAITFQELMNTSQSSPENSDFLSSPPYHLAPISDTSFNPFDPSNHSQAVQTPPTVHSPQAVYPVLRSLSASSSSFGLVPAFTSASTSSPGGVDFTSHFGSNSLYPSSGFNSAAAEDLAQHSPPPQGPPVPQVGLFHTIQAPPGRGSFADLRMRRAQTPASNLTAVYVGLPFHPNPARRAFFESAVSVMSFTPSVADLIRSLRSLDGGLGVMLNEICVGLDRIEFHIAYSRKMIEVHDPTYSAASNGYRELGPLRAHLNGAQVTVPTVPRATHNETSLSTFELNALSAEIPLFVLYIFPLDVPATMPVASQSATLASEASGHSRSHTPAPGPNGSTSIPRFLSNVLKMSSALEKRYLQDGYILASLLDSNNSTKYGTAYVQIRQSLIIENIYVQGAIPQLTLDDVAAWAGIKPATYANNRTFANNARATLQYLRAHANSPGVNAQSNDNRRKEEELLKFLSKCFLPNLITGDSESSPEALTISSTTVATVKKRMEQFQHPSVAYRGQRFTTVEALQSVPL